MSSNSNQISDKHLSDPPFDRGLRSLADRLGQTMARDALVQKTSDDLRNRLQVDRVVVYYFYRQWKGQVTFESLGMKELSIYGSTGGDDCFNAEYAAMYEEGRLRAIADIEAEAIAECHRDFLRGIQVRANLVVPILNGRRLWGLLAAHHCQNARSWSPSDIEMMQTAAASLASSPSIRNS